MHKIGRSRFSAGFVFYCLILLWGLKASAMAQTVNPFIEESKLERLLLRQEKLQSRLNATQQQLDNLLNEIDSLKKENDTQSALLNSKMAEALILSDQIESTREQLSVIDSRKHHLRSTLYNLYGQKADSLQNLLSSAESAARREKLQLQIIHINDRRMLLSPLPPALSFNPEKIKKIEFTETQDAFERDIYRDYLQTALADIDSHLAFLAFKEDQISAQVQLQNKAELFMEDVSDSRLLEFQSQPGSGAKTEYSTQFDRDGAATLDGIDYTRQDILSIHNLLQFNHLDSEVRSIDAAKSIQSWDEYLNLVKETKIYFQHYRELLTNKLSSTHIKPR